MRLAANPIFRHGVQTYFLAKTPSTTALHYLMGLATVLFVIWPKSQFLRIGSPPLTFSILALVATLIIAYLSFSYGADRWGEDATSFSRSWLLGLNIPLHTTIGGFMLLTLAHTLFLVGLAFPLLISAAHVSGVTAPKFGAALLLIVTCTLAYRWLGLLALCLWERQDFVRYVVARAAFVMLVLASAFLFPPLNPLLGLISMSFGDELGQVIQLFGQQVSYATVSLIIHLLLLLAAYIMVLLLLKRWFRDAATHRVVT
jgi:hypothetical protein